MQVSLQGGNVLAMTINKGILLGFVPSDDSQAGSSLPSTCYVSVRLTPK